LEILSSLTKRDGRVNRHLSQEIYKNVLQFSLGWGKSSFSLCYRNEIEEDVFFFLI
jgi:hypothetical protein